MRRHLFLGLFLCGLAGSLCAQPLEFDPDDFGKVILAPKQSAGGGALTFEQAFGDYQNEPILTYGENSLPRRLGRPVGRLDVLYADGKTGVCTAFIVDARHILTNNHCIPGLRGVGVQAAQFVAGYVDGAQARGAEKFQVATQPAETSKPLDYSVLRVFGDPSARFGTVELAGTPPENGELLWIIGHPQGQAQHISREGCAADDPAVSPAGKLVHSCDTLGGNSGSPVFRITDRKVVGLHHAGDNRTGYNFAIPVARILAESKVLRAAAPVPELPQVDARCDAMLEAAPDYGCAGYESFLETCEGHPLAAMIARHADRVCELEAAEDASRLATAPDERAPDTPAPAKAPAEETARDDTPPADPVAAAPADPTEDVVDLDSLSREALEDWAREADREIREALDVARDARRKVLRQRNLTGVITDPLDGRAHAAPARAAIAPHVETILAAHDEIEAIYAARGVEDSRIEARVRGLLATIREGRDAAAREAAADLRARNGLYSGQADRIETLAARAKEAGERAMTALSETLVEPDPGPLAGLELKYRDRATTYLADGEETEEEMEVTYHFLPAPEGQVAYIWCAEDSANRCSAYVQRDGFKFVASHYGIGLVYGKGMTAADIRNEPGTTTNIDITDETGGPFYPMRDGKRMTWTEAWDWDSETPGPEATYRMSVEQRCCTIYATSKSGRKLVWEVAYTFESDTMTATFDMFLDPGLGWIVGENSEMVFIGTGDSPRKRVQNRTLTEVVARPD